MAAPTNTILGALTLGLNPGNFGRMEGRPSHYGALNAFHRNTTSLFDAESLAKIRLMPASRTISIPILNAFDVPIGTILTCVINTVDIGVTKKQVVRFHVEFDIDVVPSEYDDNAISYQLVLKQKLTMGKQAVYKYLDKACAAFLDANKDTTMAQGAQALYVGAPGEYQLPKLLDFYNNVGTIMEMNDLSGPFNDVANTAAMADMNWLQNPGGGAVYATKAIMDAAQITNFEYTNRLAPGTGQRGVHYLFPTGSLGIVNFLHSDDREAPDLNALEMVDENRDISDVRFWGKINDTVFPDWQWGTMELLDCQSGAKTYRAKHRADFALIADFTSNAGESPIKRFSIMNA